jgi:L-fuconolactonase
VPWPEPDDVLYEPVLPPDFDAVAEDNDLAATVIVEASEWPGDNQWVLDLVAHDPKRYIGLVGSLEIGTPGFAAELERLSQDERFVGVRMRQRPRGPGYFNDAVWSDLRLLADQDQTLDVLMFEFSLDDVATIAERIPHLRILINHVAGADIDGNAPDPEWEAAVRRAAAHPNVSCKISGLFQQSNRQPSPTELSFYEPVLEVLWQSFGEDRLIYGSNWPVTRRGGTYADYKAVVLEFFEPKGRESLEKLLHANALSFYGLPPLS